MYKTIPDIPQEIMKIYEELLIMDTGNFSEKTIMLKKIYESIESTRNRIFENIERNDNITFCYFINSYNNKIKELKEYQEKLKLYETKKHEFDILLEPFKNEILKKLSRDDKPQSE